MLQGTHVTLEPLLPEHADELWPAADDDVIRAFWPVRLQTVDDLRAQFRSLFARRDAGTAEPYLIRAADGTAAGSTCLYNIDPPQLHATIGWTFITAPHRRTAVNTESKLLLLRRAFDDLHTERVDFTVDSRNTRSQQAVLRLGATQDGILRRNRVLWNGYIRDTVVFSILREEWPTVRAGLEAKLAR